MNDNITYFTIGYKLKEKDPYNVGHLKDFSVTQGSYFAHIVADTKEDAVEKLKRDFNMLTVEIDSMSDAKTMTKEEYENG